jgi:hypothetical protein
VVLELEEGLALQLSRFFFFLAIPWWLGRCLAKLWFPCTETANVWDGAKEQKRIASAESAKMFRSFAGIS